MPEPTASLLICTTPRSGSTYFANTLRGAGCFGMPEEWLHPYNYEPLLKRNGFSENAPARTLISCLWDWATNDSGIFAIKTMWDRFEVFLKRVREDSENSNMFRGPIPDRLDWVSVKEFFPSPRIIFLTRRDRLGQAISYIRAHQTGVWHKIEGAEDEGTAKIADDEFPAQRQRNYFDPVYINRIMNNFRWQEESWRKLFWLESIEPLEVEYEFFLKNKEQVVRQVAELMGVPSESVSEIKEPPNKPVRDSINKLWRSLYQEVTDGNGGFNEQDSLRNCANHWLFTGTKINIQTPYPVFHGNPGATVHHYFSVKNKTAEKLSFTVNEGKGNIPAELRLQAVWTNKENSIHRAIGGEVSLPHNWRPSGQEIVRLPIRIPIKPDKWALEILPVLSSETCDYRLLGAQSVRMRYFSEPLVKEAAS